MTGGENILANALGNIVSAGTIAGVLWFLGYIKKIQKPQVVSSQNHSTNRNIIFM